MTDTTGANAWGQAWLDAQRKYFEAWTDLTRQGQEAMSKGLAREAPPANPFVSGMEQWWKMMSPNLPQETHAVSQRLLEMNKGFIQAGEQMWNLTQGIQTALRVGQDWQQACQEQIKAWQRQWSTQQGTNAGWNTLCGLPLQHWRQIASSFSMLPGDVEKVLRGQGPLGASTLQHALKGALDTPAVGYTREMQEDWQEWTRLWLEHAQAVQKYEQLLVGVGNRTVEKMGAHLLALLKEGKGIESMRQAYDLWVDCAEDAYGALAQSSEFMEAQARLTNTLMAVKRQEQRMVEQVLSVYNLPTRSELDTAHERTHALRRELRTLRHAIQECGIEHMREQIDQLRAELRSQSAVPAATPAAAAPARRRGKGTSATQTSATEE